MRTAARSVALLIAATLMMGSPLTGRATDLCRLCCLDCIFGRSHSCGCGNGCESSCGCEASCGCGSCCGVDGRQFAGQVWEGGGCNGCMRPDPCCCGSRLGDSCGCGNSCGCGDSCGCASPCEPACGCSSCGCEPSCGCSSGCSNRCAGGCCIGLLCSRLFGCSGCDGEPYVCEWYNDPPRCCEPCDCYGNWCGPSGGCGGYHAPYDHPCSTCGNGGAYYSQTPMPAQVRGGQQRPMLAARPTNSAAMANDAVSAARSNPRQYSPSAGQYAASTNQSANSTGQYAANRTTTTPPAFLQQQQQRQLQPSPAPIARRPANPTYQGYQR